MISLFNQMATYYVENGSTMWMSLAKYFDLMSSPLLALVFLSIAISFASTKVRDYLESLCGMLHIITYGLLLICGTKFVIVWSLCVINFVYNLF